MAPIHCRRVGSSVPSHACQSRVASGNSRFTQNGGLARKRKPSGILEGEHCNPIRRGSRDDHFKSLCVTKFRQPWPGGVLHPRAPKTAAPRVADRQTSRSAIRGRHGENRRHGDRRTPQRQSPPLAPRRFPPESRCNSRGHCRPAPSQSSRRPTPCNNSRKGSNNIALWLRSLQNPRCPITPSGPTSAMEARGVDVSRTSEYAPHGRNPSGHPTPPASPLSRDPGNPQGNLPDCVSRTTFSAFLSCAASSRVARRIRTFVICSGSYPWSPFPKISSA